jgi:hypothetical protein
MILSPQILLYANEGRSVLVGVQKSRGTIYRAREENFKHGRPMGRPYTDLFLRVTKDHHVIVRPYSPRDYIE